MALAASLTPGTFKLWRKGIAVHLKVYFGHAHAVRQRQSLGVDLRAAYHPGIGRIGAVRQCILQGGRSLRAMGLPL